MGNALWLLGNAGSPLIWAGMLHLFFGNAVIGLVEGALLRWWYRVEWAKAILGMIAANYVSMIVGLSVCNLVDGSQMTWLLRPSLLWNIILCWGFNFALFFTITVLLEWPAVMLITRRSWRSGLGITATLQAASYFLLLVIYLPASALPTEVEIVDSLDFIQNRRALVVYGDAKDGKTYQVYLDGTGRSLHAARPFPGRSPAEIAGGRYNIADWSSPEDSGEWINHGWSKYGLRFQPDPEKYPGMPERTLTVGLPLLDWSTHRVILLPNNEAVVQLGPQIVVFNAPAGKVSFLALGNLLDAAPESALSSDIASTQRTP